MVGDNKGAARKDGATVQVKGEVDEGNESYILEKLSKVKVEAEGLERRGERSCLCS